MCGALKSNLVWKSIWNSNQSTTLLLASLAKNLSSGKDHSKWLAEVLKIICGFQRSSNFWILQQKYYRVHIKNMGSPTGVRRIKRHILWGETRGWEVVFVFNNACCWLLRIDSYYLQYFPRDNLILSSTCHMCRKCQENLLFFNHPAAWTTNSTFWWQMEHKKLPIQFDRTLHHVIGFSGEIKSGSVTHTEPVSTSNVLPFSLQ